MAYIKRDKRKSERKRSETSDRKARMKVYMSSSWRKLSLIKRQEFPLCEVCEMQGKVTPGEDVHHIESFTDMQGNARYDMVHDYSNLITVCKICHNSLHHGPLKGCTSYEAIRKRLGSL